jgi:hypothetical protein
MDAPAKQPDEFEPQKLQFAALFLRTQLQARTEAERENAAFAAASLVFPDHTGRAMWAARFFPIDPIVVNETARLQREGGDGMELPGKNDLARKAWNILNDPFVAAKDRISAMRLYGELIGAVKSGEGAGDDAGLGAQTPAAPTYTLV